TPDPRPRHPALARRRVDLGERRHLLRALQPAQGEPPAARGPDGAASTAAGARARPLHQPLDAQDPESLGALPRRLRRLVDLDGTRVVRRARAAAPRAAPTRPTSRGRACPLAPPGPGGAA